jgi:ABC-type glycerol-3-phosphate transport system substrate-binding protein
MTKRIGFILCALLLAACLFTMSGCKPSLKGMEIVIGNWYENFDTNTFEPRNEAEEKVLDWRIKIQKDNGFTMREKNIASWNEMPQISATSIMTGSPAATVFVLQGNWAMSLISQNLAFPVTDNRAVNLRNPQPVEKGQEPPEWNQSTLDTFNFGGKSYALSVGINMNNAQVVFFNKRLFREAGLDQNLPYDMQKDGTWTWENFIDVCKKLTRDTNNDGIFDTYALPRDLSTDILDAIISSNGAQYVGRDASGKFVNATTTPEFVESLQYAIRINNEGVMKPRPEGSNWDWYKAEFADGNVAMRIDESYVWNELGNMRDDWGVVLFPKGPRSSTHRVFTRENVMVIPSIFSAADVDRIMYAMALWYTPQSDDWKSSWYHVFRDSRAVDETLELIRDTNLHMHKNFVLIPGMQRGHIGWQMWHHDGDPAQLVEAVSENWNSLIKDVNDSLF